jgi:hypothetical protein
MDTADDDGLEAVQLGPFRITRDRHSNALYIYLFGEPVDVHRADEVSESFPAINVDRDNWGDPVGIEILT